MSNLPTITDVVTYLRGTGMEGMAIAVESLERAYIDALRAVERRAKDQKPTESNG